MLQNNHQYKKMEGTFVNLREVEIDDAAFILSLRTDEKKSRFLHKTDDDLQRQVDYLNRYKTLTDEWYFIIEDKNKVSLGTLRLYNYHLDYIETGSWLMKDNCTMLQTFEGDYIVKKFAFTDLGFDVLHFDVRKENAGVVQYNKRIGSKIVREDDLNYYFELSKDDYVNSNFIKFLKKQIAMNN